MSPHVGERECTRRAVLFCFSASGAGNSGLDFFFKLDMLYIEEILCTVLSFDPCHVSNTTVKISTSEWMLNSRYGNGFQLCWSPVALSSSLGFGACQGYPESWFMCEGEPCNPKPGSSSPTPVSPVMLPLAVSSQGGVQLSERRRGRGRGRGL